SRGSPRASSRPPASRAAYAAPRETPQPLLALPLPGVHEPEAELRGGEVGPMLEGRGVRRDRPGEVSLRIRGDPEVEVRVREPRIDANRLLQVNDGLVEPPQLDERRPHAALVLDEVRLDEKRPAAVRHGRVGAA